LDSSASSPGIGGYLLGDMECGDDRLVLAYVEIHDVTMVQPPAR